MKTYYSTWERNFIAKWKYLVPVVMEGGWVKILMETRFWEMDMPIMQKYVKVSLMRLKQLASI